MEVVSHCPLPVAGRVWKPRPGAYILTFVCKATFQLAPGRLSLAAEQQPVHEQDRPWSEELTSLYAATDLVPRKLRADVVLIGSAFAPGGVPVQKLVVRMGIEGMQKAVEVWCDRQLRADGSIVDGPGFTQMPLLYERAAGGPGTDNPVGMAPVRDAYGQVVLPNLAPLGARADAPVAPVGFGPLGARWPSRLGRLGRYADELSPEQWHDQPLPPDFDMAYFNVAPPDQQLPALRGDEQIVLENLHPEHPQLTMTLPGPKPRARVTGPGGERNVPMRCDTLWIDTTRGICCLTYRGQVLLSSAAEAGWVVVTLDEQDKGADASPSGTLSLEDVLSSAASSDPRRSTPATLPFLVRQEASGGGGEGRQLGGLPFQAQGMPFRPEKLTPAPSSTPPPPPWSQPSSPPAPPQAMTVPTPSSIPPQAAVSTAPPVIVPAASLAAASAMTPPPGIKLGSAPPDSPWAVPGNVPGAGTIAPVTAQQAPSGPAPGDFRSGGGALLASNAAIAAQDPGRTQTSEPAPARPVSAAMAALRPAAPKEPTHALDLVFFDPESLPRMRRVPEWKKLLAKLDDRPLDSDEDDPAAAKDPTAVEDRREALEILVHATPTDAAGLDDALAKAVREAGRYHAPLALITGELVTPFDEVEALKATIATVTPLAGNDENLRASVQVARDFLGLPGLATAPAVAEGLTGRVRDAWNNGKRAVPAGYLDTQTERTLLEQRAYQKRKVLGGVRQRALFQWIPAPGTNATSTTPLVVYLPAEVGPRLPMFTRLKVRMVVRIHLPLDQYEQGSMALEVLALARLVAPPKKPS